MADLATVVKRVLCIQPLYHIPSVHGKCAKVIRMYFDCPHRLARKTKAPGLPTLFCSYLLYQLGTGG